MKKILPLLFLTTVIAYRAQAQAFRAINQYGLKAGINLSNASEGFQIPSTTDQVNTKTRLAYYIGGFVNINLVGRFALQPELLFSVQGYRQDYGHIDIPIDKVTYSWHVINLPILGQYAFTEKLYMEAGPQAGMLVSAEYRQTFKENASPAASRGKVDAKYRQNTFDWALIAGLGYRYTSHIGAQVRYTHGLSNLSKESGPNVRNRIVSVGAYYGF